jgi:putative flippase GtrA
MREEGSRTLYKNMGSYAPAIRRLLSFLCIGGLGAALNLLCFSALNRILVRLSTGLVVYFVAFAIATELSLLHNFLLNDWMTFRDLRHRHWARRCFRFHVTSTGGTLLTLGISFSLFHFLELPLLLAQGTALVAATLFNYLFHHIFTYA